MKRRVLMLALFLVLGAIVNVAVAWVCALKECNTGRWDYQSCNLDETDLTWDVIIERSPGIERVWSSKMRSNSFNRLVPTISPTPTPEPAPILPEWTDLPDAPPSGIDRMDATGWPCLALHARLGFSGNDFRTSLNLGGYDLAAIERTPTFPFYAESVTVPLRPIWPGFAINTVFYAAVLWLLFAAPFALRRRRRIKRGLCPKCAYPVGTNEVCTECGTQIRAKATTE